MQINSTDIDNFLKGKHFEACFINLFRYRLKWNVQETGIEHSLGFNCQQISSLCRNSDSYFHDPASKRVLIDINKQPDFLGVSPCKNRILKAEIRVREIKSELSEFTQDYYVKKEFEEIREYFRGSKVIYIDPGNRKIRVLNTLFDIDDEERLKECWNNPEENFLIDKYLFNDLADLFIFDRTKTLIFSLLDYCSEQEKNQVRNFLQESLLPSNKIQVVR